MSMKLQMNWAFSSPRFTNINTSNILQYWIKRKIILNPIMFGIQPVHIMNLKNSVQLHLASWFVSLWAPYITQPLQSVCYAYPENFCNCIFSASLSFYPVLSFCNLFAMHIQRKSAIAYIKCWCVFLSIAFPLQSVCIKKCISREILPCKFHT